MWGPSTLVCGWADILMNRHLGYAESGSATLFDPSELAHALRVVCRDRRRPRLNAVLAGLRAICAAQHDDGNLAVSAADPLDRYRPVGTDISVETAMAVVATVSEVVRNPEAFGRQCRGGVGRIAAGICGSGSLLCVAFRKHAKRSGTAGTQPARPRQSGTGALRLVLGSRLRTGQGYSPG